MLCSGKGLSGSEMEELGEAVGRLREVKISGVLLGPAPDSPWPGPRCEQLPADGYLLHLPTPGTLHRHRLHLDGDSFTEGVILRQHRDTMSSSGKIYLVGVGEGLFNLPTWIGP